MNGAIFNFSLRDGSLHFLCLPEVILADELVERINACGDKKAREFLYSVPESWIDFEFLDRQFTINTQFGEYWLFVDDPNCSADVLIAVRDRFVEILG